MPIDKYHVLSKINRMCLSLSSFERTKTSWNRNMEQLSDWLAPSYLRGDLSFFLSPWRANIAKLKRSNSLNLLDLPIFPMLREWNYILPGLIYRPAVKPILALRMKARVYEVKHSERPIEKSTETLSLVARTLTHSEAIFRSFFEGVSVKPTRSVQVEETCQDKRRRSKKPLS